MRLQCTSLDCKFTMIEKEFCVNGTQQAVTLSQENVLYNCSQTFRAENVIVNISNITKGEYYSIELIWYTLPIFVYQEMVSFGKSA